MFQRFELTRRDGERVEAVWHRKFSNFARSRIVLPSGLAPATAEALYQAAKFPGDPELQRAILLTADPKAAKQLARQHEAKLEGAWWAGKKLEVMGWVVRLKFAQNPRLAELLLASRPAPIVEPSRFDDFWGLVIQSPEKWRGKNWLGRILMEVRAELEGQGSPSIPNPPVLIAE